MRGESRTKTTAPLYTAFFEQLPDAAVLLDSEQKIVHANQRARSTRRWFLPGRRDAGTLDDFVAALQSADREKTEADAPVLEGTPTALHEIALGSEGKALVIRDVTELRRLEAAVARLQRMDSLGYVTASIIHDLNNILTAIVSLSTLVSEELEREGRPSSLAQEMRYAVGRATALVEQLLGFVRRKPGRAAPTSVVSVLTEMRPLIERVAGDRIDLALVLEGRIGEATTDREELERVILNLTANARDAMPKGGRLTISAKRVPAVDGETRRAPSRPDAHLAITVTDTGVGMAPEIRARLFEPFFTTKSQELGSGFGLTTARRFAEKNGGSIVVESAPGQGTTVTLYLPCSDDSNPVPGRAPEEGLPQGTETVLIVEVDGGVRQAARTVLEKLGYRVLLATSARDALDRVADEPRIHLLLTDVVLSGVNGPTLARAAAQLAPTIKVLLMSGHTDESLRARGLEGGVPLLKKPFSHAELARAVRETLGGTGAGARR